MDPESWGGGKWIIMETPEGSPFCNSGGGFIFGIRFQLHALEGAGVRQRTVLASAVMLVGYTIGGLPYSLYHCLGLHLNVPDTKNELTDVQSLSLALPWPITGLLLTAIDEGAKLCLDCAASVL